MDYAPVPPHCPLGFLHTPGCPLLSAWLSAPFRVNCHSWSPSLSLWPDSEPLCVPRPVPLSLGACPCLRSALTMGIPTVIPFHSFIKSILKPPGLASVSVGECGTLPHTQVPLKFARTLCELCRCLLGCVSVWSAPWTPAAFLSACHLPLPAAALNCNLALCPRGVCVGGAPHGPPAPSSLWFPHSLLPLTVLATPIHNFFCSFKKWNIIFPQLSARNANYISTFVIRKTH